MRRLLLVAGIGMCATLSVLPRVAGARVLGDAPTPPKIEITKPAPGEHFALGAQVSPSYGCSDADGDSHVISCTAPQSVDTSTPGCHDLTVTVAARDAVHTATVHYVVDNADGSPAPACASLAVEVGKTNPLTAGTTEGIDYKYACPKLKCVSISGRLTKLKAGTVVEVSCMGGASKGCPSRLRTGAVQLVAKRSSLSVDSVLRGNKLRKGAKVNFKLKAPGARYVRIQTTFLEPRWIMRFRYFYEMPDGTEQGAESNTRG